MELSFRHLSAGMRTVAAIAANRLRGSRRPLLSTILLTNRCNLQCVYCYSNAYRREMLDMDLGRVLSVVDQLAESGGMLVTLLGGEPLLRSDLGDIISHVRSRRMLVEVITNGLHFEAQLTHLRRVDFLCVSVDGDEPSHDANRGRGSWRTAMRALDLAVANGIVTRIHACFTRHNAHALPHLMELARSRGVRLNIATPSIHTSDPSLAFSDEEVRAYYRQMLAYKRCGYPVSNATGTLEFISSWPGRFDFRSDTPQLGLPFLPCRRKDFNMYINVDGNAYPCINMWGKHTFNVFELGVQGAFDRFAALPCATCIGEAEFNLLFSGRLSSLVNLAALGILDRLRRPY